MTVPDYAMPQPREHGRHEASERDYFTRRHAPQLYAEETWERTGFDMMIPFNAEPRHAAEGAA